MRSQFPTLLTLPPHVPLVHAPPSQQSTQEDQEEEEKQEEEPHTPIETTVAPRTEGLSLTT